MAAMTSTGWFPVARAAEVGTAPVPVGAGGEAFVVVRLQPGGEVSAFPARCPHRLVPLAAATVTDGRLQCAYHGWRFDADGRCVDMPSLAADGTPPPRADLPVPWAVDERHGWIWLAPERTTTPSPPCPSGPIVPEAAPEPAPPGGPLFDNTAPSLDHAWHPVALSRELRPGGWQQVRLLGRTWTLRRTADGLAAEPPAFAVREHLGLVWLAPAEPLDLPLAVPEVFDRRFVSGWLPPVRSLAPAAPLADALLDTAHVPLVHGGPAEPLAVEVTEEPGGFSAVREYETTHDRTGERRRIVVDYCAPFQLRLRQELPQSGVVSTALVFLQPEDPDSTRIYARVLLSCGPGRPLPLPSVVVEEMAAVHRMLEEDVRLQARLGLPGLPLDVRQELHVAADRLGVALRRALCDFATAAGRP
jgi:phenylpropionate dioxygenase-like ring-hydroxylating dioxygenase large terminal subunit